MDAFLVTDMLSRTCTYWSSFYHFDSLAMHGNQPIHIERVPNSKKLFIIFGGISSGIGVPPFEFIKASNILNDNRIFVRDLRQNWYHSGLPGISKDINGTKWYLETLIQESSATEVVMVGNSMGGFAALLFSSLIGNSRAVAFAPQTFISPLARLRYRDRRWEKEIRDTYKQTWRKPGFWNLRKLRPHKDWAADIYVAKNDSLDHQHALNVKQLAGVSIYEYETGGHSLVKELRDRGELAHILVKH